MSDTLLVSTRKGLFTVSRKAGQWEITGVDFLGDNVSITLTDRRDGRHYAALDHGHFGVKLHRSTATGWEEIAAPTYPPKPEGYEEYDMWGRPLNWSTARIWALEAGGPDEPGVIWCGTHPGRPVPLDRSRAELGDGPRALGSSQAQAVDGRWRRSAGHPFDLRRPAQFEARVGRRSRPAASGSPRMPARAGRNAARACAPSMCPPELTHDPIAQDVHCLVQCPAAPRPHVGAAPQRHLRLLRRGQDLRQRSPASSRRRSGSRSSCIPQEPDTAWFVPEIKDEKRIPCDGKLVVTRTRDGGKSFDCLEQGPAADARL